MKKIKRRYKKKKRNSFFKNKFFWIFVSIFLFFAGIISYLFFHPYYQLNSVEVTGSTLSPSKEIENLIFEDFTLLFDSRSLPFIPLRLIKEKILGDYPHVRRVDVRKVFPNRISIIIEERKTELIWCVAPGPEECFEIDSTGTAFRKTDYRKNYFYIHHQYPQRIHLGESVFPKNSIDFIFDAIDLLQKDFDYSLVKALIPHKESVFFKTSGEVEIRLSLRDSLSTQLERLKILLDKEISENEKIEYIELRYGNRVFYKPRE